MPPGSRSLLNSDDLTRAAPCKSHEVDAGTNCLYDFLAIDRPDYRMETMNGKPSLGRGSSPGQMPSRMPHLDALRTFAVIGVAYFHWVPTRYHYRIPFWGGVPLFFVLSGYLISSILVRCRHQGNLWFAMRAFYARRCLRLFPLFYSIIALAYLFDVPPMTQTILWHLSYLSNFDFFFHEHSGGSVSHFWSLAVEERFYLIWPATDHAASFWNPRFSSIWVASAIDVIFSTASPNMPWIVMQEGDGGHVTTVDSGRRPQGDRHRHRRDHLVARPGTPNEFSETRVPLPAAMRCRHAPEKRGVHRRGGSSIGGRTLGAAGAGVIASAGIW